ncbi:hypothetical protein HDV64DRAFT_80053 [Trichoderma sp. TUCIM 5745]
MGSVSPSSCLCTFIIAIFACPLNLSTPSCDSWQRHPIGHPYLAYFCAESVDNPVDNSFVGDMHVSCRFWSRHSNGNSPLVTRAAE